MLKLSTHFNALTEAFDKPYKFTKAGTLQGFDRLQVLHVTTSSEVDVLFQEHEVSDEESVWSTSFERKDGRQDHDW